MSEKKAEQSATPLAPGTRAPVLKLKTTPDQSVSLSDFRGAPVILAFYPADWSPVCGDQMALYNQVLPEFRRFNAIGTCCRSPTRTRRWRRSAISPCCRTS